MKPVRILASEQPCPGGEGRARRGEDRGQLRRQPGRRRGGAKAGYTQVLWLDGVQRKYLDEVGTMNIMVRIGDEVITPPLAGTILDGDHPQSRADPDARLGPARIASGRSPSTR